MSLRILPALVLALVLTAAPAAASPSPPVAVSVTIPLFGGYWDAFYDHWRDMLRKQNGIIVAALGVGAVSLFIITRGKWQK